jgi:hypothetical protein
MNKHLSAMHHLTATGAAQDPRACPVKPPFVQLAVERAFVLKGWHIRAFCTGATLLDITCVRRSLTRFGSLVATGQQIIST